MNQAIPVITELDSGADGAATWPASYCYTIRRLRDKAVLATSMPLDRARPCGSVHPSKFGIAYRDAEGNWHLSMVSEVRRNRRTRLLNICRRVRAFWMLSFAQHV